MSALVQPLVRLGLTGCLVAACTDDGYQVRYSQELAAGSVTVEVRPEGELLADVPVLIHDRTGALFAEVATDRYGTVQTEIPADAQVTVLLSLANHKRWAALTRNVQPGAELVLDGMPDAPFEEARRAPTDKPFQLKLVPFEAPAGGRTSAYYIDERAAHVRRNIYELEAVDTEFGPYTREPLTLDRYGKPGKFGVLAYARTGPDFPPFIDVPIVAYSFGEVEADAPGAVLEMPPFRTDFRTLNLDIAAGVPFVKTIVTGYQDSALFELSRANRNATTGSATMIVPPGFGTLQSARACGAPLFRNEVCSIRYETELPDHMQISLPEKMPFSTLPVEVRDDGPIVWSPPALGDARPDESLVFEARWLEDHQFFPHDQGLVAWTVAYAADQGGGELELPSLPTKYRRFYPLHIFSGGAALIRASATFMDRETTLNHFGSWPALLRSGASVERIPGANAGDHAELAAVRESLPF